MKSHCCKVISNHIAFIRHYLSNRQIIAHNHKLQNIPLFFSGWHMYLGSALSALRWEQRHTFIFRMSLSCKNPSFYLLIQNIFTTHKSYLQTMLAINSDDRTSKQYKYWSFFHSGSRSAPQQSIMTKCVPPEHLGKVRKSFCNVLFYYSLFAFPDILHFWSDFHSPWDGYVLPEHHGAIPC